MGKEEADELTTRNSKSPFRKVAFFFVDDHHLQLHRDDDYKQVVEVDGMLK
jgi:hypothetical protein